MNKVMFIGRLTKDVELKEFKESNKCLAKFRLAVDRGYHSINGEKLVDFIPVVAWDKNAEILARYTGKGNRISVIGRLQIKFYETKDGEKRQISQVVAQEIQILDWKKQREVG